MFRASPADLSGYLIHGTPGFLGIHGSIVVSGFIHTGHVHLIGNLIFLSVFGPPVEKTMGRLRFALFYLAALCVSFYVHAIIHPHSSIPVVGASGAIAAIMGAYLILNPKGRILTIIPLILMLEVIEVPSLIFVLLWFVLQGIQGFMSIHTNSPVAWFSHIGAFSWVWSRGSSSGCPVASRRTDITEGLPVLIFAPPGKGGDVTKTQRRAPLFSCY
jgi:hypothetical protein